MFSVSSSINTRSGNYLNYSNHKLFKLGIILLLKGTILAVEICPHFVEIWNYLRVDRYSSAMQRITDKRTTTIA